MDSDLQPAEEKEPFWLAYGPAKDAWKADGNYYTAAELAKMEEACADILISDIPKKILHAD
jgi:hypothetical protein